MTVTCPTVKSCKAVSTTARRGSGRPFSGRRGMVTRRSRVAETPREGRLRRRSPRPRYRPRRKRSSRRSSTAKPARLRIPRRSSKRRASSTGVASSVATTTRSHRLCHRSTPCGAWEESQYVLKRSSVTETSDIGTPSGVTAASRVQSIRDSRSPTPRCETSPPPRWASSHSSTMKARVDAFRTRPTDGGDWPSCLMHTRPPHRTTCSTLRLRT